MIATTGSWTRLLAGLVAVFGLFHGIASGLGSDRGQAGIVVGVAVVVATLGVQRWLFGQPARVALKSLGLGRPTAVGITAAALITALLLVAIPIFAARRGSTITMSPGWAWLLPGLLAQAGIAEEVLFRGYLFRHLRQGRTFRRAALLSMGPFAAVHLLMFVSLPWPVAAASLALAVVVSFPLARLFELGGDTIWAPALLHFVIQGAIKVVVLSGDSSAVFPLVWIAVCAVVPYVVFLIPSRVPSSR